MGQEQAHAAGGITFAPDEVRALRQLLEGVMTLASHGILFRFGQTLGASIVKEAKAQGGPVEASALKALQDRGWLTGAQAFPQRVQVTGSVEAEPEPRGGEPTCHILRGVLQRVLEESRGPHAVREVECQSAGASACVFEVVQGGRRA